MNVNPADNLGRLEEVNPRDIWPGEATDFTPWLLDHADHLAEALGIDLELQDAEHPVGGYSLDLIGQDLTNDTVLIVENQLEVTDHTHLGQILTYAAGTKASTIVWIATGIREEHRQVLDWLNEETSEDLHFFGIVLRVVKIGDSQPAPLFEMVVQPNDWQKQVRASTRSGGLTARQTQYVEFWGKYLERVQAEHPGWTRAKRAQPTNWMNQPSPVPGTNISPSFAAGGRLRHELYIDVGDRDGNMELFERFREQKETFEQAYGRPLSWEELPEARACRIADYTDGEVANAAEHDGYLTWFLDAGKRLRVAIATVEAKASAAPVTLTAPSGEPSAPTLPPAPPG